MVNQELNIKMDERQTRDLIIAYIKDSHHDFFKTNEVFSSIWMDHQSISDDDPSSPAHKRQRPGQGGGSGIGRGIFEKVIIEAGLGDSLRRNQHEVRIMGNGELSDYIDEKITNSDFYELPDDEKIKFTLAFNRLFPDLTDYALGYITEDELYDEIPELEPELEPEPESEYPLDTNLEDLIEWTTKIDEATKLKVFLDNNYLSAAVETSSRGVGELHVEGSEMKPQLKEKLSGSPRTPQNLRYHPYGMRAGGSSLIGGMNIIARRRSSRRPSLIPQAITSLKELQGELKKIHKMISVWDGLIKKMRDHRQMPEGEEKELFQNLDLANNAQGAENQLRSSFEENLISSRDVYVGLMGEPSSAAEAAAAGTATSEEFAEEAVTFNRKIEEILNEEPTHETEEKLKKINILFNSFNKYAIGGGKGKLTSPGDDIFNKFISKKWTSAAAGTAATAAGTAATAAGTAATAAGTAVASVQFIFRKLFNKKSSGIELRPDDISVIEQFQVLIMKHGWFEELDLWCDPSDAESTERQSTVIRQLPQWLRNFRERVCAADTVASSSKMQRIGDNQFSKEFSENEFGIDFTKTGVWKLQQATLDKQSVVNGGDGPADLISIINNSKTEFNSGDNASLRKPYTTARAKTISIFKGDGEEANCNAPNVADPGPNCPQLKHDIRADQIIIKVFSNDYSGDNYSVLYQLNNIRSGRTTDLRHCTMTVKIKYNDKEFEIQNTSVSNKSLSKNVVLNNMMTECKRILYSKMDRADAPDDNDYKGVLTSLVGLLNEDEINFNELKPIVQKCLCKLFGDHGQELFAVGMLVDDDNRSECNSATLAGNDRISYCRLLHMLKYSGGADTDEKQWAAIYNSAASYNMIYKTREAGRINKNKFNRKTKRKSKKRRKSKRKNSKSKNSKRKTKNRKR